MSILVSCSNEVPGDKLVERQGIIYEVNTTKPFTGKAALYFSNDQPKSKINFKDGKRDGLSEHFYETVN